MKLLNNKLVKFSAKLLISLAFVVWLLLKINWGEVLGYASRVSLLQIILYIVVLLIGMIISSYKWKILSEFKGFKFPLEKYFQLYLTGTFINNFFPSFIGGDTYKAYQIGRNEKKYIAASATVVMDRITGLLAALALSVVFAFLNWRMVAQHQTLLYIFDGAALGLVAILMVPFIVKLKFWKNVSKKIPNKISEIINDFVEYRGSRALNKALILAIVFSLIGLAGVNYVLFWSLGINVGIIDYLTVIFLISFISALPISINNIGVKEWAYVTFFGFFGVSASAVITVALLSRILQMIVSFAALPAYLKSKQK
jgi:uncharacterized protein (TIRG00374 family)